jgi:multidrug efflux pump subunit AcrB
MMWLVRLALNRPYTFVVASMLILILSVVAVVRTPTDIFPDINIPVVSVVWGYTGLAPEEIERRMVTPFERSVTTTVNDVESPRGLPARLVDKGPRFLASTGFVPHQD